MTSNTPVQQVTESRTGLKGLLMNSISAHLSSRKGRTALVTAFLGVAGTFGLNLSPEFAFAIIGLVAAVYMHGITQEDVAEKGNSTMTQVKLLQEYNKTSMNGKVQQSALSNPGSSPVWAFHGSDSPGELPEDEV